MSLFPIPKHVLSMSSIMYAAGLLGLSVASAVGLLRILDRWKGARVHKLFLGRGDADTAQVRAEVEALRRSLAAARAEVEAREALVGALTEELERAKEQVGSVEKKLEDVAEERRIFALQQEQEKEKEKEQKEQEQEQERQAAMREAEHTREAYTQTLALLEERTVELAEARSHAQTNVAPPDLLAGTDIITMLEALNARILATAIQLSSSFKFTAKPVNVPPLSDEPRELREAYARASEIVGARMAELLRASEHHEDPGLVQIAVQTGMAAYCEWMISSWYFENPQNEQLLSEIYERVRESEEQAVAGRWRALTRSHVQKMISEEPDLAMYFTDAFVNVLLTAGVPTRAAALHETITIQFAGLIAEVVRAALQLNRAIGEGVTACELEVLYVGTDAPYDAATMGDSFGARGQEDGEGEGELVLCATDLGLVRSEKVLGEPGQWRDVVLLRPRVVLQSALVEVK